MLLTKIEMLKKGSLKLYAFPVHIVVNKSFMCLHEHHDLWVNLVEINTCHQRLHCTTMLSSHPQSTHRDPLSVLSLWRSFSFANSFFSQPLQSICILSHLSPPLGLSPLLFDDFLPLLHVSHHSLLLPFSDAVASP